MHDKKRRSCCAHVRAVERAVVPDVLLEGRRVRVVAPHHPTHPVPQPTAPSAQRISRSAIHSCGAEVFGKEELAHGSDQLGVSHVPQAGFSSAIAHVLLLSRWLDTEPFAAPFDQRGNCTTSTWFQTAAFPNEFSRS